LIKLVERHPGIMGTYTSCNCRQCRLASAATRGQHKKTAHKALRKATKQALRKGEEAPVSISTGYKD
jgi:hypothetical protein